MKKQASKPLRITNKVSQEFIVDEYGLVVSAKSNFTNKGGKYWGHLARENGKLGSLPLFDNYSDEASPD